MNTHTIALAEGETLLAPALRQGIDVAHDCGGALACVSCQVVVREGADRLLPPSEGEIDLLDRAAFLAQQLAKHPGAVAVRLAVRPAGCSGLRHAVDPAAEIGADDRRFREQRYALHRLDFANPNATQTCGCGESFGIS